MYGKLKATKETIYKYINDFDIFKYYISNFKDLGTLFRSEIRSDKSPTCCINKYEDKLLYVDFADINSKGLDVFSYIGKKYNVNFYEVLDIVTVDFNLPLLLNYSGKKQSIKPNKPTIYNLDLSEIPSNTLSVLNVKVKPFDLEDKKYWKDKYDISVADLRKFNVYSLQYFTHKGEVISMSKNMYGYYFGKDSVTGIDLWKCYAPYGSKKIKWRTNCGNKVVQGYSQLPEQGKLLIITKSMKDIIVLSKLGIPSIAPQAENHLIPEDIIAELRDRFKYIYVLFDNDEAGIRGSVKYSEEYKLPYFYIPLELEIKDSAEVVEYYDYKLLNDIIYASCYTKMGK